MMETKRTSWKYPSPLTREEPLERRRKSSTPSPKHRSCCMAMKASAAEERTPASYRNRSEHMRVSGEVSSRCGQ